MFITSYIIGFLKILVTDWSIWIYRNNEIFMAYNARPTHIINLTVNYLMISDTVTLSLGFLFRIISQVLI